MTILNSWTDVVFNGWIFGAGLLVTVITFIFIACCDETKTRNIIICFSAIALAAFLMIAGAFIFPKGTITTYQVIFDDSIPITEVLEKYEIVDQEGLIYTIEDKEITKG